VPFDLSCYHIDDEYTFSEIDQPLDTAEKGLILRADQVFVSSPGLWEKKGWLNPHTVFIPNGVHYDAYVTRCGEPLDLQPIPRPRIGYIGVIKQQLDLALLMALAKRHRQWSFVLVGPQKPTDEVVGIVQGLARLSNVYFLGGKAVAALPAYTQHMDVCIMCYKINDYTKYIYPLKLHEYLASGRPCVGAPIRSLQEFVPLIQLAGTLNEWSHAISEALAPAACSVTQMAARRSTARRHDWDRLVARIAFVLCDRLGSAYRQWFEKLSPALPDSLQ
jgi:glycosyltransferase involved in cell wall biosynthesis